MQCSEEVAVRTTGHVGQQILRHKQSAVGDIPHFPHFLGIQGNWQVGSPWWEVVDHGRARTLCDQEVSCKTEQQEKIHFQDSSNVRRWQMSLDTDLDLGHLQR